MTSQDMQQATDTLEQAVSAANEAPKSPQKTNSRTADKFVIRGYLELWQELDTLGIRFCRSRNSEAQMAVLEGISEWERTSAMLNILVGHLGDEVSAHVLAALPEFEWSQLITPKKFVLRFPPDVRDVVRDGIENSLFERASMNDWFVLTLIRWINLQRQLYALQSAAIAINPALKVLD